MNLKNLYVKKLKLKLSNPQHPFRCTKGSGTISISNLDITPKYYTSLPIKPNKHFKGKKDKIRAVEFETSKFKGIDQNDNGHKAKRGLACTTLQYNENIALQVSTRIMNKKYKVEDKSEKKNTSKTSIFSRN